MSQSGVLDIEGSNPSIPTQFDADTGFAVPIGNVLEIVGGTNVTTTATGNVVTINAGGSVATTFTGDSGTATPSGNNINLLGGSNGIDTVASGATVTFNFDVTEQPAIATSITTDSGTCTPALNTFAIVGGSGVDVTASGSTITIVYDGAEEPTIPTSFPTDSGSAVPALNVLNILGGTGLISAGSGNTVTLNLDVPVSLTNGGTNASLTASDGGIFYSTATAGAILPGTATATQMLQSGASGAPAWSTSTWPATTTANQLLYSSGTNTVSGLATANRAVVTTDATGVPVVTALATDGQLIIGSTAGAPAAATLTAGSGIAITNGSNSITIASSAPGVLSWVTETGATRTLSVNQGVIGDRATAQTFALPTTAAVGDIFQIVQVGAGAITIAQNASQQIRFGSVATTSGAGGSLASIAQGNSIEILCWTADTAFVVLDSEGSWTVV